MTPTEYQNSKRCPQCATGSEASAINISVVWVSLIAVCYLALGVIVYLGTSNVAVLLIPLVFVVIAIVTRFQPVLGLCFLILAEVADVILRFETIANWSNPGTSNVDRITAALPIGIILISVAVLTANLRSSRD